MSRYVAVVPGVPALLPGYRGRSDSVAELRAACRVAGSWLAERSPSRIAVSVEETANPHAMEVATSLLAESGFTGAVVAPGTVTEAHGQLIVANGSARRGEKAPGHLDPRAFEFDQEIGVALANGDAASLGRIDVGRGRALLAEGLEGVRALSFFERAKITPTMVYADDPYGVLYWVVTWECAS